MLKSVVDSVKHQIKYITLENGFEFSKTFSTLLYSACCGEIDS